MKRSLDFPTSLATVGRCKVAPLFSLNILFLGPVCQCGVQTSTSVNVYRMTIYDPPAYSLLLIYCFPATSQKERKLGHGSYYVDTLYETFAQARHMFVYVAFVNMIKISP